ncbi:MAG: OsmC family peroxiredoxin [Acidobacteria bacterium]|nr:MAG: OsmC family peroxiredoxin [Acidobacteriota bacterium]
MTGTFGGALEARQIDVSDGKLTSETQGEIELDGDVLVIRRIFVRYKLRAPQEMRETIERIHSIHADHCPVARSIRAAIEVRTSFELVAP